MPSERIQRRIEALLDQAEEAADRDDWDLSARRAREALAYDASNEDALAILGTAEQMDDTGASPPSTDVERHFEAPPSTPAAPPHPERFAGDRYEVLQHLGDGGTKRVFLVRDSRLDRDR